MKTFTLFFTFLLITSIGLFGQSGMTIQSGGAVTVNGNLSIIPNLGLVAYYPFNGNANDESGNGYNGSNYGGTLTNDRFGNSNRAYHFINNYVSIPTNVLNNLSSGTVSAFLFLENLNVQNSIIDKTETFVKNYLQIIVDENNTLRVLINKPYNQPGNVFYSNATFTANHWYHITVSWGNQFLKIYVNGQQDGIFSYSAGVPNALRDVLIGKVDNNTAYFSGVLDDIKIYNYALSDAEILALYHEGGWVK